MALSRREFSRYLVGITAGVSLARTLSAQELGNDEMAPRDDYSMIDIQRGKQRALVDFATTAGYAEAAWLMRDASANYIGKPHPQMLRLMAWLQAVVAAHGSHETFIITSGARLRATNARIEGAADNSRHIPSKTGIFSATDLQPTRFPIRTIADVLAKAKYGGIGEYQHHLHVDYGRVARWSSMNHAR